MDEIQLLHTTISIPILHCGGLLFSGHTDRDPVRLYCATPL